MQCTINFDYCLNKYEVFESFVAAPKRALPNTGVPKQRCNIINIQKYKLAYTSVGTCECVFLCVALLTHKSQTLNIRYGCSVEFADILTYTCRYI